MTKAHARGAAARGGACAGHLTLASVHVGASQRRVSYAGGKWRDLEIQHGMSSGVNHVCNLWASDVDRFGLLKNVILYSCNTLLL